MVDFIMDKVYKKGTNGLLLKKRIKKRAKMKQKICEGFEVHYGSQWQINNWRKKELVVTRVFETFCF